MLHGIFARARSLLRGVRRRPELDAEMEEEFRHHMELRAADLERSGLSPAEARRQARLEFGSTESYKDDALEARGLRRFDLLRMSALDFKLGARMLVKYPGLTVIGGLAIAFAIAVGATTFELVRQVVAPRLPLPQGDEIVALATVDIARGREVGVTTRDYFAWRGLASLRDVGAHRTAQRNVTTGRDPGEPVVIAEITASAFRVTRTPPLLGRALVPGDEAPDAPPVVVIGYDLWQNRFAGDSAVIGRMADVGGVASTIVGVMPQGYRFPAFHTAWVPLRLRPTAAETAEPLSKVFARLAPGRSQADAQAELSAVATPQDSEPAERRAQLRARVGPFANDFDLSVMEMTVLWSSNLAVGMLLVLVCGNVALLMFARAATRQNEIVVRNALGASRARIVMQLFSEALVLAALAAGLGLGVTHLALESVMAAVQAEVSRPLPFWMTLELSPPSYAYAAVLTLVAAVIAGVVPGFKVTAGGMDARLRQVTAGAGIRFGGVWTAVIVAQVAVTMAFPVTLYFTWRDMNRIQTLEPGFAAEEFLTARVDMDPANPADPGADTSRAAHLARYATRVEQLRQRLQSAPGVKGVTYANTLPLMYHPHRMIDLDDGPAAPEGFGEWTHGYRVSSAAVDPRLFDVLGIPVTSGRGFTPSDADSTQRVVVVNESFVRRVMGGHNPVGRRLRFIYYEGEPRTGDREPGPWYEIVGVTRDVGVRPDAFDPKVARIYHAALPAAARPLHLAVHVQGDPRSFAPTLRTLARDTDPALRLSAPLPLSSVTQGEIDFLQMWVYVLSAVSLIALALSLAGIYAVMAFAVAKRTREIGVRVALGASPRRVIGAVFRRPLIQLAMGIGAGALLIAGLMGAASGQLTVRGAGAVLLYSLVMLAVCLLACVVPTRRALRVQPTEALRAET